MIQRKLTKHNDEDTTLFCFKFIFGMRMWEYSLLLVSLRINNPNNRGDVLFRSWCVCVGGGWLPWCGSRPVFAYFLGGGSVAFTFGSRGVKVIHHGFNGLPSCFALVWKTSKKNVALESLLSRLFSSTISFRPFSGAAEELWTALEHEKCWLRELAFTTATCALALVGEQVCHDENTRVERDGLAVCFLFTRPIRSIKLPV